MENIFEWSNQQKLLAFVKYLDSLIIFLHTYSVKNIKDKPLNYCFYS